MQPTKCKPLDEANASLDKMSEEIKRLNGIVAIQQRKLERAKPPRVFLTIKDVASRKVMTINDDLRPKTASLIKAAIQEFVAQTKVERKRCP